MSLALPAKLVAILVAILVATAVAVPATVLTGQQSAADAPPLRNSRYKMAMWPPRAPSPDFHLFDTSGRLRTIADYRGHIVIVFFGFVHCPDVCPAELLRLSLSLKRLGPARGKIRVLFITLDPQRDTPDILAPYVAAFDPGFVALTGGTSQIDQAAASFNVEYARVGTGDSYTIDHSTSIYLFDADGTLRLVGSTNTPDRDFDHDLSALAAE